MLGMGIQRRELARALCDGPERMRRTPVSFLYSIAAALAVLAPMFATPAGAQQDRQQRFALVIGIRAE